MSIRNFNWPLAIALAFGIWMSGFIIKLIMISIIAWKGL